VNELLTRNGTTLTYDDNGNMTTDGSRTYAWDEENRLSSVNGASYQYDALGRRIAKMVDALTTHYVYDGWQVAQEVGSDGITKSYLYGNYIDEPVCMITATGTSSDTVYCLQGNNYNVAALADETGQVVEHYGIEPYGTFAVSMGKGADGSWFTTDDQSAAASVVGNEVVFQGRTVDPESGDYYFRTRQYRPLLGRFASRDQVGYKAGDLNLQRFELNRPADELHAMGEWVFRAGDRDLGELSEKLKELCESKDCCNDECESSNCTQEDCKLEASIIGANVLATWYLNYGRGHNQSDHNRGGYLCWDWQKAFYEGISAVSASCFSASKYQVEGPSGIGGWDHFFVKIYACKEEDKCLKMVDDGFGGGFVHDKDWSYYTLYPELKAFTLFPAPAPGSECPPWQSCYTYPPIQSIGK
jgi:RHS repeat-associated protein